MEGNSIDDSSNSLALIFHSIIEESVDKKTNKTGEVEGKDGKVCPEDIYHHMKLFLILCAVMLLLCISGFIFVILKVSIHTHTNITF